MATPPPKPPSLADFDPSKFLAGLKIPPLPDLEAVMTTHKRNLEALTEANRLALEGAQVVAKRHMEIMQSSMSEMTDALKELTSTANPASRAAKHAELMRQTFENAVTHSREMGELIQKANTEALGKLNNRFSEAMQEVKALFDKTA